MVYRCSPHATTFRVEGGGAVTDKLSVYSEGKDLHNEELLANYEGRWATIPDVTGRRVDWKFNSKLVYFERDKKEFSCGMEKT